MSKGYVYILRSTNAKRVCVKIGRARDVTQRLRPMLTAKLVLMTLMLVPIAVLADNDLYMILDLSGGSSASAYTVSYLSAVPEGGWNDEYKTTKLVLRRIDPGTCGVTIAKSYYIGVFEVTQKQYELVTGETPSCFAGNDKRPVEQVSYNMLRGSNKGSQYPSSTAVDDNSFMGRLRTRAGLRFDLPSESQWEYACRAGTTTTYNYGDNADGDYMWCLSNSDSHTHDVGTRKPNSWGLYDFHGNIWEWCLDWFPGRVGQCRVERGGSYDVVAESCAATSWSYNYPAFQGGSYYGFRLCCNEEGMTVQSPTIGPDSSSFSSIYQVVTLSCETDAATIFYTVDGSDPSVTNGRLYKGPFGIYQTTTIKAIAVKDEWKDSVVASVTLTKENAIGPAINLLEVLPDNDTAHPWKVVTDVTHDGVSAVKSGAIEDDESTALRVVIYGAGELSFWWRASCEPNIDGEYYDFGTFYNGGMVVTNIAGETDWQQVTIKVPGTAKHTFKWTYEKDGSGSTVHDGIWIDQVQWLPETTDYYADYTLTTQTPVKYCWLRKYGLGVTNDFEQAAKAKTGKCNVFGRELTVEDDYICGTDPTNTTSQLKAFIDCSTGTPDISWEPDLSDERTYKIWGSENLSDWEWPTNALHRFFKVTVEMK